MQELTLAIRDLINEPRVRYSLVQNQEQWNQICSSLDTIEDNQLAIDSYQAKPASDKGEQYLRLYGVLQAMVLQQDAAIHFSEALGVPKALKDYPALEQVREIRNRSIGHPTRQTHGRKGLPPAHHFISRVSLNQAGFELLSADGTNDEFTNVALATMFKDQAEAVTDLLESVFAELKKRDTEKKAAFSTDSLAVVFSHVQYSFEKLSEALRGSGPIELGRWGLDHIKTALDAFVEKLERRGLSIAAYPGVDCVFKELNYPLAQLEAFVAQRDSDVANGQSASVFCHFLWTKLQELRQMASEIDKEFAE